MPKIIRIEAKERIADQVALFWLKSSRNILERGLKPSRLTPIVRSYVLAELDIRGYCGVSTSAVDEICDRAIQAAKLWLKLDSSYHELREYFLNLPETS